MLSITHAATGAFIASKLPNPILYIPLALAAHYAEDFVLHWDVGTGLSNGSRKRLHAFLLELVDLAIAAGVVWLLAQSKTPLVQTQMWIGATVGLMPDFIEAPRNFFHWNPCFLKPFHKFHHFVHHSTARVLQGLWPQIVLLVGFFWFR